MTTMFADGMAKVLAGETAAEEVVRVLGVGGTA
jgi:type II secretory ATPase GspE/PulE/Tfp pilus assembly ATPase PilB-like protein